MNWNDLKVFLAVARASSLRRASAQTGLSISSVSRRLDALEQELGTKLFHRRATGYTMTTAGQAIWADANNFEQQATHIEKKVSHVHGSEQGEVIVTLPDVVFTYILADELLTFMTQYPDMDMRVITSYEIIDMPRGEADIAVRYTKNPPESLVGRKLPGCYHNYYASRSYLARHSSPAGQAVWIGQKRARMDYYEWIANGPFPDLPVKWEISSYPALVAACKGGLGMTPLPCFIGDQEPELIRVGNHRSFLPLDTWLLTHNEIKNSQRIQVVMHFLSEVFCDKKHLLEGNL